MPLRVSRSRRRRRCRSTSGAFGKALLAFAPPDILDEVLALEPSAGLGRGPDPERLRADLADIVTSGVARSVGEVVSGSVAIAVPIFREDGIVAAIGVTGPEGRCGLAWRTRVGRLLPGAASSIVGALGPTGTIVLGLPVYGIVRSQHLTIRGRRAHAPAQWTRCIASNRSRSATRRSRSRTPSTGRTPANHLGDGEWYLVAFRSIRQARRRRGALDALSTSWPTSEAAGAPGFIHYFKGPAAHRRLVPVVLPVADSRADARAAAGGSGHVRAVSLIGEMYAQYTLEFHRVSASRGRGLLTFEPYDAAAADVHGARRSDPRVARPRRPARDRLLSDPARRRPRARPPPQALRRPCLRRSPRLLAAIAIAAVPARATTVLPRGHLRGHVAILIGLVVGRVPAVRLGRLGPGLKVAAERLLRLGIVLLGRQAQRPADRRDRPAGARRSSP